MDLFLIAHKVRGEPAFDIAERMTCPSCQEQGEFFHRPDCSECDGEGFWWIVSTSGHRAYPFATWRIIDLCLSVVGNPAIKMPNMPPSLPDHYPTRQAKPEKSSGKSLLAQLGLLPKVVRRL